MPVLLKRRLGQGLVARPHPKIHTSHCFVRGVKKYEKKDGQLAVKEEDEGLGKKDKPKSKKDKKDKGKRESKTGKRKGKNENGSEPASGSKRPKKTK